ncbi:hypothetical protein EFR34_09725, partial [Lactobacillus delbrueckii subsp. lactis]|nr:hypothetical protein [Lactobacillus delbrueckii subsp. lactis]
MSSILYDQLQSMALKQYIKQLAPEKLQQLIKNPDISEEDLKLIANCKNKLNTYHNIWQILTIYAGKCGQVRCQ